MTDAPAWVRNDRHDLLAANRLGYALYADMVASPAQPPNAARFVLLDPTTQQFFPDWEKAADDTVAFLRSAAGSHPYDRDLSDLIGELSTRSETFRTRWASHNVRFHRTGVKRLHHAVVGDLELTYESMQLASDPGLTFLAYTTEPGSPSSDALRMLASWAATQDAGVPSRGERTARRARRQAVTCSGSGSTVASSPHDGPNQSVRSRNSETTRMYSSRSSQCGIWLECSKRWKRTSGIRSRKGATVSVVASSNLPWTISVGTVT